MNEVKDMADRIRGLAMRIEWAEHDDDMTATDCSRAEAEIRALVAEFNSLVGVEFESVTQSCRDKLKFIPVGSASTWRHARSCQCPACNENSPYYDGGDYGFMDGSTELWYHGWKLKA